MFNLIKKYFGLIDDIATDFLTDIKSLRYQLVLAAFAFNIYLLNNNAAPSVQMTAIGLLSAVYGMYFYSKHKQAEMEANSQPSIGDGDPGMTDRDPDNI
jgi:hypothetical protein